MTVSLLLSSEAGRARVQDYKQIFPPLGIYAVRCEAAGLLRLGASRHVDGTLNRLRFELAHGTARDAAAFVAWLDRQPAVDARRGVGTTGYCMGGPFAVRTAAL